MISAAAKARISTLSAPLGSVVGETPEIQKIYHIVQTAARTTHPVLIVGEVGTGKEVIARTIHSTGPFQRMPFVNVDCALIETAGLERALFSGPDQGLLHSKAGCVTGAYRGTLFLDRIGDLNLEAQARLLRALQEKELKAYAGRIEVHMRVLAANTFDLQCAVAQGAFRRDLYFRLNVLSLRVPPLRERRRDIPLLVSSFLNRLSGATGRKYQMSDEAIRAMLIYDWPGNVRELENCVERACCSAIGLTISLLDLPRSVSGAKERQSLNYPDIRVVPLNELEKRSILETMLQVRGDKQVAADLLGISKNTLYRRLREYARQEQQCEQLG